MPPALRPARVLSPVGLPASEVLKHMRYAFPAEKALGVGRVATPGRWPLGVVATLRPTIRG